MKEATMAELRNSKEFFKTDELIKVIDGRKKEEIGYFVPKIFKDELLKLEKKIKAKRKKELLKRIANAQKKDPIGDGAVDDGL